MGYESPFEEPCTYCTVMTTHRRRRGGQPMCRDCGLARQAASIRDQHYGRGEHSARWQAAMNRAIERGLTRRREHVTEDEWQEIVRSGQHRADSHISDTTQS